MGDTVDPGAGTPAGTAGEPAMRSAPNDPFPAERWERLAAVPDQDYLGTRRCTLDTLLRIAAVLGYQPSEVRVGASYDGGDELVIELWVRKGSRPELPELGIVIDQDAPRAFRLDTAGELEQLAPDLRPDVDGGDGTPSVTVEGVGTIGGDPEPLTEEEHAAAHAFACDECDRTFRSEAARNGHIRTHRDRRIPCPEPTCDHRFVTDHAANVHWGMSHKPDDGPLSYWREGDPFFGCDECPWYTNTEITLALHAFKAHNREATEDEKQEMTPQQRDQRLARSAS